MQEIHSIAGGSRLFGGGGGGDRRLRPHLHHQAALKCPRCDSLNTKFCYYNNYNLSQPRHFCKGCRRYWTKGGVLRNVPVGGGCRKTKRSSNSKTHQKSTSNSSSETSSLTATPAMASVDAVSAPSPAPPNSDGGVFSEIGSFTETLPFGFGNVAADETPFAMNQQFPASQWEISGYVDQMAHVDPSGSCRLSNVGFGPLDWQPNGDHQALFDLPSAVDQAYWSQHQWTDQDQPNLYLP